MIKPAISWICLGVLGLVAVGCAEDGTAANRGTTQQASAASSVPRPASVAGATITIDGVKCGDGADQNPWLEPAGSGRWILNLEGPACGVMVQISGDTEKGFPQTGADAWEGQPHIKLFKRVPNSEYLNEHLLSHESKVGSEATVASGGNHVVAWGTVTAWEGFELPKTHEIVVDFAIP